MNNLKLIKKKFDLLFPWKIARGVSTFKNIYFIQVDEQLVGETAFNVRFGETEEIIEERFAAAQEGEENDIPNSLRAGLSSAHLWWEAKNSSKEAWQVLELPRPSPVSTSFSVPILEVSQLGVFFQQYHLRRFSVIKLKIGRDTNVQELLSEAACHYAGSFRLDFNESRDDVAALLLELKGLERFPIELVEQPFASAKDHLYRELLAKSPFPVFLDESITDQLPDSSLVKYCHGINFKLMKSGGPYQLKAQVLRAQELGLKTMLGCMVETTLGISQAMLFSGLIEKFDLDGFLFLKDEPFHLVQERDGVIYPQRLLKE